MRREAAAAFAGLSGWSAVTGGADAGRFGAGRPGGSRSGGGRGGADPRRRPAVRDPRPVIEALLAALTEADGAIPALPVADTLKRGKTAALSTPPPATACGAPRRRRPSASAS